MAEISGLLSFSKRVVAVDPDVKIDIECFLFALKFKVALTKTSRAILRRDWEEKSAQETIEDALKLSAPSLDYIAPSNAILIKHLPSVAKSDIRNYPGRYINKSYTGEFWLRKSSGTSGKPIDIVLDSISYFDQLFRSTTRILERTSGARKDGEPINTLYFSDNPASENEAWPDPWGGGVLQFVVDTSCSESMKRAHNAIEDYKPDIISVRPTILEALVRFYELHKHSIPHIPIIVCSGSHLDESLKLSAQSLLSTKIYEAYGLTEFGVIASECAYQNGMHIDGDVSLNTQESDSSEYGDNRGEIIVSSLRNVAMPLIQYLPGDVGLVDDEPCPCGRRTPRLKAIFGRTIPNFVTGDGKFVSANGFGDVFNIFSIQEFQITQVAHGDFIICIDDRHGKTDNKKIKEYFQSKLGSCPKIEFKFGQIEIRPEKFQRFRVNT